MRKILLGLAVLATLFMVFHTLSAQELDGRAIAEKVKNSNKTQNRITWAKMVVVDKGKELETRNVVMKSMQKNGKDHIISRFLNGLKRDVTFLTIERGENEENLQYIYIPGVGRPRQIASSEKQNNFEDTDFTNEDMGGRKIEDYQYKRLADETIKIGNETFDCYVVIAVHKNKDAKYPKHKSWIDKKTFLPVQVKVFGKDGKLKKEIFSAQIKEIKSGVFMPFFIYAKDAEIDHETRMTITQVKVDTNEVNESLFDPNNMNKPWKEK